MGPGNGFSTTAGTGQNRETVKKRDSRLKAKMGGKNVPLKQKVFQSFRAAGRKKRIARGKWRKSEKRRSGRIGGTGFRH